MATKERKKRGGQRKQHTLEKTLMVRMSIAEKAKLEKMAKEAEGKTMSGVVRELIESAPGAPRIPDPEDLKKMTPKEKEEWIQKIQE